MANATMHPGPPGQSGSKEAVDYEPPPSLPLQVFLFCAFLITVAAYLAGQTADHAAERAAARGRDARLDRLAVDQAKYLAYVKLGFQAEQQKHYAEAVSNFQSAVLLQSTVEARTNLGNALLLQSRTNDALKEFQAAQALDPRLKLPLPLAGKP
jgi:tetratricopeptide (TPR) repeat protein